MEDNKELLAAKEIIEQTGVNLFVTGRAGTGKTTFLRNLRKSSKKRIVVLAPTGIAAINAGGMTIHSFFQLGFNPFIPEQNGSKNKPFKRFSQDKLRVIQSLDTLIIDEVSMVRADLMDAIDDSLRRLRHSNLPFGGVQLLLIGDLAQLTPVTLESEWNILSQYYPSPYFFDSYALKKVGFEAIELKKVYRQKEGTFLNILNNIRENRIDNEMLGMLNERVTPKELIPQGNIIRLVTHNHMAESINNNMLDALPGKIHSFKSKLTGDFNDMNIPAEKDLILKLKSQVMFIKNDSSGLRRYYNGMLGTVTGFTDDVIIVSPADGTPDITVERETWKNNKYTINDESKTIEEECVGEFTQFPLRKAWAITIHKSQGLTFDSAIIDSSAAFAHGQTYVALSRCRSLEGLYLEQPIPKHAIISDRVVGDFIKNHSFDTPDKNTIEYLKRNYTVYLLDSLFNFNEILIALDSLVRVMKSHFQSFFPTATKQVEDLFLEIKDNLQSVARKFAKEYRKIISEEPCDNEGHRDHLDRRLAKASLYFLEKLNEYSSALQDLPDFHDNKEVESKINQISQNLNNLFDLKKSIFKDILAKGFTTSIFLNAKMEAQLKNLKSGKNRKKVKQGNKSRKYNDIEDMILFNSLQTWRREKAESVGKNPNEICSTKILIRISNSLPINSEELKRIQGVGKIFLSNYGDEVLKIITEYKNE